MHNLPVTWNQIGWIIWISSWIVSYGIMQINYFAGILGFFVIGALSIIAGIVIAVEWCDKNVRVKQ